MTDTQTKAGGVVNQSTAIVSADQVTILGDGTTENPLRASPASGTFDADFLPDLPLGASVGMPVAAISTEPETGIASVKPADAGAGGSPYVIGIVVAVDEEPTIPVVTLRGSGPVALTTAQWDAITGQTGGLTPGIPYFLDAAAVGALTTTAPVGSGEFVVQVGVAINATTMLLSLPAVPVEIP